MSRDFGWVEEHLMTQKSLPPLSATPSHSPHPHLHLGPSEGATLERWESDSPWLGRDAMSCCPHSHPGTSPFGPGQGLGWW